MVGCYVVVIGVLFCVGFKDYLQKATCKAGKLNRKKKVKHDLPFGFLAASPMISVKKFLKKNKASCSGE